MKERLSVASFAGDQVRPPSRVISTLSIVQPGSPADGQSLRELRFETETGMFVLAIQRGARWAYRPRGVFRLLAGDRLISVGPDEGEDELIELCGEQPERDDE